MGQHSTGFSSYIIRTMFQEYFHILVFPPNFQRSRVFAFEKVTFFKKSGFQIGFSPSDKGCPCVWIAFLKPWDPSYQKIKSDLMRSNIARRKWTSKSAEIHKKSQFRKALKRAQKGGGIIFFIFLCYLAPKYPISIKKSIRWVFNLWKNQFEISIFWQIFIPGPNLEKFKWPVLGNRLAYGQIFFQGFYWGSYQQNMPVWAKFEGVTSQDLNYCLILRKSVS